MTDTMIRDAAPAAEAVVATSDRNGHDQYVRVAALKELTPETGTVVRVNDNNIAIFLHGGRVYAVDNRCPHMGFPLQKGSVKDGILTCHWHHARFDLACGGTFDPWADDVRGYPVEIRGGGDAAEVWLDPDPPARDPIAHQLDRLRDGLKYNLRLVIAKSVIGLLRAGGSPRQALAVGAEFGTVYAANGWGAGLTILTAMGNLLPYLDPEDQTLALYQGLTHVANECAGQAPRFPLDPLPVATADAATLKRWFREFVERRDGDGAQRCLRTAIEVGVPAREVADMVFTATTDHMYRDVGHPMDFANKACELLDEVGWESAGIVLTSVLPRLVNSSRQEESSAWRHPVDIAALLWQVFPTLPDHLEAGRASTGTWSDTEPLGRTLLSDDPAASIEAMTAALRVGATMEQLAGAVAYAAALRIALFHTRNEFGDWDTVLHTFTYANAIHQAMRRAPSIELLRGVFDAAMSVYLDRFLNTPPAPLPARNGAAPDLPDSLLSLLDRQAQVNEAGQLAADALANGARPERLIAALGAALVREDAAFHTFQSLEAAVAQWRLLGDTEAGRHVLIAAARYLASHAPTARASNQTFQSALRLQKGEALYEG